MSILLNIPTTNEKGIYCIKNNRTGVLYIGSSSQLQTRALTHARLMQKGEHSNKNLKKDLSQYKSFTFQVVYSSDGIQDLEILELKTIKTFLICGYKLYNCDTIESIERRLRTYERWKIYNDITPKRSRRRYTRYQFVNFSEERQQKELKKVCEITNCQPGQIMEYVKIESAKEPEEEELPEFMRE